MKYYFRALLFSTALVFGNVAACSSEEKDLNFRKQPELQQIRTKKPVKIKLKRTAKDEYTWELSGDDADEILKIDRKLRKVLKEQ